MRPRSEKRCRCLDIACRPCPPYLFPSSHFLTPSLDGSISLTDARVSGGSIYSNLANTSSMSIRSPLVSSSDWRQIPISLSELCLDTVLRSGQSFRCLLLQEHYSTVGNSLTYRWKRSGQNEWTCTLRGRVLRLQQYPEHVRYRAIFPPASPPPAAEDDTESLLRDYFNLSINLTSLYKTWSDADPNFLKKSASFGGIRILRQDPWENVISFICSSNNNIQRISQMVNNLCLHFGPHLVTLDSIPYHDFPPPSALTGPGVEKKLRDLGFGYRAKYIANTAAIVANERPSGWLDSLRTVPYREAHDALLELPGVGPKVADCVCLMSMDKTEALPVDTHVWQIAQRDYKFRSMKGKTLNKATYDAIGDYFRALWGKEAGWAHSVSCEITILFSEMLMGCRYCLRQI